MRNADRCRRSHSRRWLLPPTVNPALRVGRTLGGCEMEFYDAVSGGSQVGSTIDSHQALTQSYWENLSIPITTIPATARSIEILALSSKPSCGSLMNAGFDDLLGFIGNSSHTFLDQFAAQVYTGNDGTQNWSNDWQEIGEADGPSDGEVRVRNESFCAAGNCLRLDEDDPDWHAVSREADLSGSTQLSSRSRTGERWTR